jgi:hypothetical protein
MQVGPETVVAPHRHHGSKGRSPAAPKAAPNRSPRAQFLHDLPSHEYLLPNHGAINATLVDLIVILPQWFRNPGVSWRFLNNGINAAVHFAILEEHRHLSLTSTEEAERARDHISDTYRKTMRKTSPGWTKAKHQPPTDWPKWAVSITNFFPEAAKKAGYVNPPSIPFKNLAIGLKKLPRDYDAGDLTRALDFALRYQKLDERGQPTDFMFPDDIHLILRYMGLTEITEGHLDEAVIQRYTEVLRISDGERRKQLTEEQRQQQAAEVAAATFVHPFCPDGLAPLGAFPNDLLAQQQMQPAADFSYSNHGYDNMPPIGMGVLMPDAVQYPQATEGSYQNLPQALSHTQCEPQRYSGMDAAEYGHMHPYQPLSARSNSQEAAAAVAAELLSRGAEQAHAALPDIPDICKSESNEQDSDIFPEAWLYLDPQQAAGEMDALIAANQTCDFGDALGSTPPSLQSRYLYHPDTLLRDCPEWRDGNDNSDLARASRWAQQYSFPNGEFKVADIDWVLATFEGSV